MYCPHCNAEREPVRGVCPLCGYALKGRGDASTYVLHQTATPLPGTLGQVARGDVLRQGRYRLVKQLQVATNQQGASWSAVDTALARRRVVIREVVVPSSIARRGRQTGNAVQEAAQRLAVLGQHPGLPDVFEVFEEQGSYYIVLSEVEGETLSSLLQRRGGALPEPLVAQFGWQLCDILSHFSPQQPPFVHGSINPDTIVVGSDGKQITLIELPVFRPEHVPVTRDESASAYLAPEQVRGSIEPSSDLFAVAAVLHHIITGYDPRERVAFFYPPARRLNPSVTPEMERILGRQLHVSLMQRYSGAAEMQKDFARLLETYSGKEQELEETPVLFTNPVRLSTEQRREWSRSNMLLNVGVFVAVLVLILIGLLFVMLH